jgi:hypothetical protein
VCYTTFVDGVGIFTPLVDEIDGVDGEIGVLGVAGTFIPADWKLGVEGISAGFGRIG